MDNATHALVGLLLADLVCLAKWPTNPRAQPATESGSDTQNSAESLRGQLRLASIIANNLCDADIFYARPLGGKLGYLLHHRGHTHTLLVGLLLSLGLYAAFAARRVTRRAPLSHRRQLLTLCLLGPVFHMGFDALNNYGVHPFWPLDLHWYYGDTLFIIEPWFWIAGAPAVLFGLRLRWAQGFWWLVLAAGVLLAWGLKLVPWPLALLLTFATGASILLQRRLSDRVRVLVGSLGVGAVVLCFGIGATLARSRVADRLLAAQASEAATGQQRFELLDVVLTPAPGNPLCYSVVSVETAGNVALSRAASLSLLPSLIAAKDCAIQETGLTLGLSPAKAASNEELWFQGEWRGDVASWRELKAKQCEVNAFAKFARAPYWRRQGEGSWLLGDLRFDRDPDLDFDEFYFESQPKSCPEWLPTWLEPRREW